MAARNGVNRGRGLRRELYRFLSRKQNKDQLSLANPRDELHRGCITANVLHTNKVDAQCDKLATELN